MRKIFIDKDMFGKSKNTSDEEKLDRLIEIIEKRNKERSNSPDKSFNPVATALYEKIWEAYITIRVIKDYTQVINEPPEDVTLSTEFINNTKSNLAKKKEKLTDILNKINPEMPEIKKQPVPK